MVVGDVKNQITMSHVEYESLLRDLVGSWAHYIRPAPTALNANVKPPKLS
jgi:hypothetical protein